MANRLNSLAFASQLSSHNSNIPSINHYNDSRGSYSNSNNGYSHSGFNPRSVSLDIRTPEELAAVNSFLVTLGRDVTALNTDAHHHSHSHRSSHSRSSRRDKVSRHHHHHRHSSMDTASDFGGGNLFDAASLAQLGLAGMPGLGAYQQSVSLRRASLSPRY